MVVEKELKIVEMDVVLFGEVVRLKVVIEFVKGEFVRKKNEYVRVVWNLWWFIFYCVCCIFIFFIGLFMFG